MLKGCFYLGVVQNNEKIILPRIDGQHGTTINSANLTGINSHCFNHDRAKYTAGLLMGLFCIESRQVSANKESESIKQGFRNV